MSPLSSPLLAAALLLVLTGLPKLRSPAGTAAALHQLGLRRAPTTAARAVGLGETAVGVAALAVGGRWLDATVAAAYAGFAVVLVVLLRRGATSCGCSGAGETPPTRAHLVLVAVLAGVGVAAATADPVAGLVTLVRTQSVGPIAMVLAFGVLAGWLASAVVSLLPALVLQKAR